MIKAAMIGLGWWGRTLVESVQGASESIRFVAGATRTQTEDVKYFAKTQDFTLQDSLEVVLGNPDVDAVVLATPHSMHAAQVAAAAEAGKHVFCEKPFTLTKADAQSAVAATEKAGVTLGLGYNRRFHPTMQAVRDLGDLGRAGHDPSCRGHDDLPQCAVAGRRPLARRPLGDAVRRADADGRAHHRFVDRHVRAGR